MADKKTVVVIGASFAGLATAKGLARTHNVVLIDRRDYFDMNFTAPRLLQDPDLAPTVIKKLSEFSFMSQVTLKQDTVTELHSDRVVLRSGETVQFDYCVIASGSTYANEHCKAAETLDVETRLANVKATSTAVKQSNTVLVIGGGHTGIKVAAEVKEAGVPSVTLVQSASHLSDSEKRGKIPLSRLRHKLGLEVILGQRAQPVTPELHGTTGPGVYSIAGQERSFDMVFKCVGFKTAHPSYIKSLGAVTTNSGFMDVNESFQVKGFTNIFATGDAVDVDDDHVAYLAVEHGKIAAKAIATLTKKPDGKLPTWKRSNGLRMTITTLGKKNAMANIGSETVFTWVPGNMLNFKIKASKGPIGCP